MDSEERKRLDDALKSVDFGPGVLVRGQDGSVVWSGKEIPGFKESGQTVYRKQDGTWTGEPLDISHFSIGEDGAIKLTAPEELYNVPEFDEIFDPDTIKSYSSAYRSNPAYRVPYVKRNDDGTTEETQITIPEFVDELNVALDNFVENYKVAEKNKKNLVETYGEKANKLSLTQLSTIASANADANRVYLPDFVFNTTTSFSPLKNKRDEDKTVDVEEFMKYYQLGKTSETELAALLATIEGHLKASEWGDEEVSIGGDSFKNNNSMSEAVGAMALKNFILSKDPDAEWYESLGAGAATLAVNAAEGIARVFMNLGTTVEGIVTFGQSHIIQNTTENMDNAMSDWNQDRMLIQDSTATLSTLGQIGGMLGGTVLEAYLLGKAGGAISSAFSSKVMEAQAAKDAVLSIGPSAYAALTPETLVAAIDSVGSISLGAKFAMSVLPIVSKVALATQTAKSFMKTHKAINWATAFLLDTVHDAIFYDAVTLRHVLEGDSDQDVKNYWIGQLEDNAKWWIGTGFAKSAFRFAGKTDFGQALKAESVKKIQGLIANVGDAKKYLKDSMYGGDFVRHMEEIRDSLANGSKKDSLNKKIEIAKAENLLRKERKLLSQLDLEWDGLKLTDESMKRFNSILTGIKDVEDALDNRSYGTTRKVQEIVGQIVDPSTGRLVYINKELGVANAKLVGIYSKMMKFTDEYNLPKAPKSNLSQDMIDYLVGSAERKRKLPIAAGEGPNAELADANIKIIDANLRSIEDRLPEDVIEFLADDDTLNSYFKFYRELRNYQDAKNIIDRGLLASYRGEGGEETDEYMPVVKAMDESDLVITRKSGAVARSLDEDFEEFTYVVKEGQHYVDPEVVRQRALWQTAEDEISQDLRKAYQNLSSATVVEKVSGETSARVANIETNTRELNKAMANYASSYTQNWSLDASKPEKKRKFLSNLRWEQSDRAQVAATLSLSDTTQILQRYNVLEGGNTRLSDMVSEGNFDEWYPAQSQSVKNYLNDVFSKYYEGDITMSDAYILEDALDVNYAADGSQKVGTIDNSFFVKKRSEDEQKLLWDIYNILYTDSLASSGLGNSSRVPRELMDELAELRGKVKYKGYRSARAIQTRLALRAEEYGDDYLARKISSLTLDNGASGGIAGSQSMDDITRETSKLILKGDVDVGTRIDLAKKVASDSNGEKLVAWRTQSEGVDGFYGSSGGTGTWDEADAAKWAGGRWISIGGEPFNTSGYGGAQLVFPVNKTDILFKGDFDEYKEAADDILALRAKTPDTKQKIAVKSLKEVYGDDLSTMPRYDELSRLSDDELKKIADGDPRAILDVSGKKIVESQPKGRDGREFVLFPDRNPELLQDGVNDMARAATENENILEDSIAYDMGKRINEFIGVDPNMGYTHYTADELKNTNTPVHIREKLAEKAVDDSRGTKNERVILYRMQKAPTDGTNIGESIRDDMLPSSSLQVRDSQKYWDGGKVFNYTQYSIESADANRFTDNVIVTSLLKKNILSSDDYLSMQRTAKDIVSLRAGAASEFAFDEDSMKASKYYSKLNELSDEALSRIADGDPKEMLKVAGKKAVAVPGERNNYTKSIVVFPDQIQDVLDDGAKSMEKAGDIKYDEFKGYDIDKLKSGKYSADSRLKLALDVEGNELNASNGENVYRVFYRLQDNKTDGFGDSRYAHHAKKDNPVGYGLDDAYFIRPADGITYDLNDYGGSTGKDVLVFVANDKDYLNWVDVEGYRKLARQLLDYSPENRTKVVWTADDANGVMSAEDVEKIRKLDDDTLKKIASGDAKTLLDVSGRKIIDVTDAFGHRLGTYIFPDRNPEILEESFKKMSEAGDVKIPENRYRHDKRAQSLIYSKENLDFLNHIGWDERVHTHQSNKNYAYIKTTFAHISVNLDEIDTLAKLFSAEFHELAHAAWAKTTIETRKAIGNDLLRVLGFNNLKIDDAMACSKDLNELIAHAVETRFQSKHGWDLLKNDSVTQEHIANLAKHSGYKLTKSFKDRVLVVLRSLVTFIKTKVLGINSARTFDEFYYGLGRGDFADELRYGSRTSGIHDYDELSGARKIIGEIDTAGKHLDVKVGGPDSVSENVDIDITHRIPVQDLSEGPSEVPVSISKTKNIPIKYRPEGAYEITPDFYPDAHPTYEMFKRAYQDGGDDFEAGLQRAYIIGDDDLGKKGLMTQLINDLVDGKNSFEDGFIKLETRQALRNVLNLDTDKFVDSMYKSIQDSTNDYVKNAMENPIIRKTMDSIAQSGENGAELASKYAALKYLTEKDGKKNLAASIEKEVRKALKGKNIKSDDVDLCVKRAQMMADEYIKAEFNDARNALKTINSALVDGKDMMKEVKDLHKAIYGEKGLDWQARKDLRSNIIVYRDEAGREVYAEVDPNFASLYKMRYQLSQGEASALAKFNAATSKLFRYGTTTLNLSSFSNQLFRDTGNALIVGGAWNTIKHNADNLVEVFGHDIVEQIKRFEPEYEFKQLKDFAKANNMSLERAAVSRELARGAALSPASTETTLYKNLLKADRPDSNGLISGMNHKLRNVLNKFASIDEWTNGRREEYLRNRVFASNLNQAMEEGYTIQQARVYATFAMNNATTNFTRQVYHMQAIADSTPYFRAAINGTKSFWRMWSVDPVGITGRMMGGLILPTIFLTGASLGDPENREVYKNIPEYQKDENFVFVVDKQIITIPMPQEMSNIVNPFRQFVEYLYDADQNSFWELMMNDALGFSPVDLTGFSTIDMDKMSHDSTLKDRITRGFARVFSQVAPVPVRSTYMMVTGTDPYTGKNLYDPSYTYWDDDTNSVQTMNDYQNAFAKWVAKLWGKDSNATVLEKVTSNIFGSTGANFLGELVTLIEEGPGAAAGQAAQDTIKQATNPYYADYYNQADAVWKRAVRALTAEKEAITSSDEFKTIYSELSQTTDESKRKKLNASGQNLINEYQNKVITTVQRLSSVYEGTFDRKKLAATIQLLNFNTDPIYQSGTQYSSNIASDSFYEGRESAIATMRALGVTGASDLSIFGYLTTDDEGKSVMKYSSPVAIMDMKNSWYGAGDIDQANIEAKLKTDGIKLSDKWDGYYAAKNKGASAVKQYKSEWNAKVVKSLAPYISERGVDSTLKDSSTRKLLENYLFVDNLYQVKAYLKKIFENE